MSELRYIDPTLRCGRTAVLLNECQNDLIHESKIGSPAIGTVLAAAVQARNVLPHIANIPDAARAAS